MISLIRTGSGEDLRQYFVNGGKKNNTEYVKNVKKKKKIEMYQLHDQCIESRSEKPNQPPWEDETVEININPLAMKKESYIPGELKCIYNGIVN